MPLRLSLIAAVLVLTAAACSGPRDTSQLASPASAAPPSADEMPQIAIDEPFALQLGEEALFTEDSARVRFDAVESDGRCPLDVTCVWAGEATARFTLVAPGVPTQSFTLTIPGYVYGEPGDLDGYQLGMAGPYAFALLLLEPYPGSGAEDDAPVTATLHMRRLMR